jgi:hypothetical protein
VQWAVQRRDVDRGGLWWKLVVSLVPRIVENNGLVVRVCHKSDKWLRSLPPFPPPLPLLHFPDCSFKRSLEELAWEIPEPPGPKGCLPGWSEAG